MDKMRSENAAEKYMQYYFRYSNPAAQAMLDILHCMYQSHSKRIICNHIMDIDKHKHHS